MGELPSLLPSDGHPFPGGHDLVKYLSPSVVSLVSWIKMMENTSGTPLEVRTVHRKP